MTLAFATLFSMAVSCESKRRFRTEYERQVVVYK